MNIALYIGGFPPQMNGVISYVIDTARALTERGHTVVVFAPKPHKNDGIDTSMYPFSVQFLPSVSAMIYPDIRVTHPSLLRLTKIMRELDIDIVHVNDPSPLCMEGMIAAKMLKLPVVVTFHTFYFDPDILNSVCFRRVFGILKSPLVRINAYFHNFADIVICPSVSAQKELLESGLTAPNIIIHNSIDFSQIRTVGTTEIYKMRQSLHIPAGAMVGIFSGRMAADKRIDVLLKAWVTVCRKVPMAYLVLIGCGPEERSLKVLTHKLHLDDHVVFAGRMKREELLSSGIYSMADIYVSASRIENQSMSMIEALAHGLPVVSVNMRGVSELVDETCGVLTGVSVQSLAKGIVMLFSDPKKLAVLKGGARTKAGLHDSRLVVKQVEATYERVIRVSQ